MIKKIVSSTVFCLLTISSLAENINVKQGWNLMGAPTAIELNRFDNSCVDYILKYNVDADGTKLGWQHYIANGQYYNYEGTEISSLKEGDGFWVMASSDCSVKINDFITPPIGSPVITTDSFSIEENTKDIGFLKSSLDNVTYKIVGGDDHIYFNLDESSGMLEFKELRNYEAPDNFNQNNSYNLEVSVTSNLDALLTTKKTINISVTNQNDKFRFYDFHFQNMKNYYYQDVKFIPKFTDSNGDVTVGLKITSVDNELIGSISKVVNGSTTEVSVKIPWNPVNEVIYYNVEINATDQASNTINLNTLYYQSGPNNTENAVVYTEPLTDIDIVHNKLTKIELSGSVKDRDSNVIPNVNLIYSITTAPKNGTLKKHIDGTWWYRPNHGYFGSDSFTYQASAGISGGNQNVVLEQNGEKTVNLNIEAEVQ
ncbi:MAG: Ig-like domain-containing protein [Campylobacterota bacterium]|nr:Ig-like domain-containing protein [Campylobacterota bacterium]